MLALVGNSWVRRMRWEGALSSRRIQFFVLHVSGCFRRMEDKQHQYFVARWSSCINWSSFSTFSWVTLVECLPDRSRGVFCFWSACATRNSVSVSLRKHPQCLCSRLPKMNAKVHILSFFRLLVYDNRRLHHTRDPKNKYFTTCEVSRAMLCEVAANYHCARKLVLPSVCTLQNYPGNFLTPRCF